MENNKTYLAENYQNFIGEITILDFLLTKQYFEKGNDIEDAFGGVFRICKLILASPDLRDEDREMFETTLSVLKIIYKLAYDKSYFDVCVLMLSAEDDYIKASTDIKEFMIGAVDSLEGEFVDFVFKALATSISEGEHKVREFYERMLKEIFILYRICVEYR